MARPVILLVLALGICGARAQWTATTASAAAGDPVASAVSKMLETLVQPKQQLFQTFTATAAQAQSAMQQQYAAVKGQAEAAIAAYEQAYCTPAQLKKSVKKPATFTGHGFAITFTTGNCSFNHTKYLVDGIKELDCVEPSISYIKTPANFTSHYIKAPVFIEKKFGEQVDKVLYVFDSSQPNLDVHKLTEQLTSEVKSLLSSIGGAASSAWSGVAGAFNKA
eukprot:scaffold6.g2574.t1